MSVYILGANSNYGAQYNVPANGVIRFEVEAEHPIVVQVMDATSFAAFRAGGGSSYTGYGPNAATTVHKQNWTLPFRGPWYLVMINYNPTQTAVYFNAWS
jgi:hypothetical protein